MAEELSSTDKQKVIEEVKKWLPEKRQENLNLFITGKTAVGKSRLVNALVGKRVAKEGRPLDPCTSEVTCYQAVIEGETVTVLDSPGLQDETSKEPRYKQDMKDNIKDIDLMTYCVRMDETRFYEADKKAIQTLTEVFGKEVWNHAVVALTFANKVEDPDEEDDLGYFKSLLQEWEKQVKTYFTSIGIEVQIPLIPVGNASKSMRLPDRENWLSDLWVECYHVMAVKLPDDKREEIENQFKKWISSDVPQDLNIFKNWCFDECPGSLNILITGKTGVGKSRLVNAFLGKKVVKEGKEKDPCTLKVACYQCTMENVAVTVWDSPGLQDGTTNEDRYIQDMKDKIKDIALMIYCVRMDEARFHEEDKKAIKTLTEEFGKEVWNHAVVALTFAYKVEAPDEEDELGYFQSQLEEWEKQLKEYFTSIGIEVRIPMIPVGNERKSMRLPDRENWLSQLWIECYHVMEASARLGIYRINRQRLIIGGSNAVAERRNESHVTFPAASIPLNDQQERIFNNLTWEAPPHGLKNIAVKVLGERFVEWIQFGLTGLLQISESGYKE